MRKNVGGADKVVRIIVGLVLLSLLFFLEGSTRWIGLVGLVPLLTGLTGSCPLYTPFGFSTCRTQKTPPAR